MSSTWDTAFRVLADSERIRLLTALEEHSPRRSDVLRVPDDIPLDGEDPERLRIRLYHTHLPRMEDAGFIRWDRDADEIAKGPRFDELRPLLRRLSNAPEGFGSHE